MKKPLDYPDHLEEPRKWYDKMEVYDVTMIGIQLFVILMQVIGIIDRTFHWAIHSFVISLAITVIQVTIQRINKRK